MNNKNDHRPEAVGIIPARGGSKGVPRKNIRDVAGKPLIAWMIHAARGAQFLSRVIVSTDDEEIASVARAYGAEVPFMRPKELAEDLSTDVEVLSHALNWLKDHESYEPDVLLRLPPTSPLCRSADIDTGIQTLIESKGADAVRPITESPKHPYKMWQVKDGEPFLTPFLDESFTGLREAHNLPRQLFPKVYVHTGAMDVMWVRTLIEQRSTSGKQTAYFSMDPESSVNIDTHLDLAFAEFLLKRRWSGDTVS